MMYSRSRAPSAKRGSGPLLGLALVGCLLVPVLHWHCRRNMKYKLMLAVEESVEGQHWDPAADC